MTELTLPVEIEIQHYNAYLFVICGLLGVLLVMEVVNAIGSVHDVMASRNVMYHMYREQAAMLGQEYHDHIGTDDDHDDHDLYHRSSHNNHHVVASDEELHERRRLRKQRERERRTEIAEALLSKKVVATPFSKSSIVIRSKKRLSSLKLLLSYDDDDDDTKSFNQGNRSTGSTKKNNNESNRNNSISRTSVKNECSEEDDSSTYKQEMSQCEQAAAKLCNNQISHGMNNVCQQQPKQSKSSKNNQQCHPIPIFERRKSNIYVTLTEGAARRSSQRYSLSQTLRLCPDVCHICLGEYKLGEDICWSRNPTCIHAFHRDCIVEWLLMSNTYFSGDGSTTSQDNEKQHNEHDGCPCCRQSYFDFST